MITPQPVRKRKREVSIANPERKRKRKLTNPWSSQSRPRKSSGKRRRQSNPPPAAQVLGNIGGHKVAATKARNAKRSRGTRGGKAKRRRSTAKRKQNPFGAARQHRASNPTKPKKRRARGRRAGKKRNPTIRSRAQSISRKPLDMLKTGAMAAAGLLATRQLPQILLKSRNVGIVGYAANTIVAAGSAALASRWAGKPAGAAVLAGGMLYVFTRLLNDFTPLGKTLSLSGVGDPMAAGHLGALVPAYFPMPVVSDRSGTPIIPQAITDTMRASMPANGVSVTPPQGFAAPGAVSRFAGRF